MKSKLFLSALLIFVLSIFVNAQDRSADQGQQTAVPAGRGVYVDANNNGICDYYEQPGKYSGYGRRMAPGYGGSAGAGRGRGLGPGQGRGLGTGQGWGRALQPGQGRGLGPAKGWGRGLGPGQGRGAAPGGRYFVDENKNGVCDRYERSITN